MFLFLLVGFQSYEEIGRFLIAALLMALPSLAIILINCQDDNAIAAYDIVFDQSENLNQRWVS